MSWAPTAGAGTSPLPVEAEEFKRTYAISVLWEAHRVGRERLTVLFTLGAGVLTALIGGLPLGQIPGTMSGAFGAMMTRSACVIIFGIMYGELMEATGGLSAPLTRMVKRTGANG